MGHLRAKSECVQKCYDTLYQKPGLLCSDQILGYHHSFCFRIRNPGSRVSSDSISRTGMSFASGKLFEIHSSLVLGEFGGEI